MDLGLVYGTATLQNCNNITDCTVKFIDDVIRLFSVSLQIARREEEEEDKEDVAAVKLKIPDS